MRKVYALTLLVLFLGSLAGCSFFGEKPDKTRNWSAQRLYSEATSALKSEDYTTAINYYQKLESRFPFGPLAQQAQLNIAYAYYKQDEPASAIAAADRFIKLNPSHPDVDYAYYLKGIVSFNQGRGFIDRFLPTDDSQRDPASALQAFQDFDQLVRRFPNSKYAPDARQRMVYLRNTLAKHEIHVANFYMKRKAYVAAVNRARYVIENYSMTPSVPDALLVMVRAYELMKLPKLAAQSLRVLKLNYPKYAGVSEAESLVAK